MLCTGSAANYYIKTGSTTVATACDAGFSSAAAVTATTSVTPEATFSTSALGCLIACSAGCQYCAANGAAKCDTCLSDYVFNTTPMTCTLLTDATRDPSCATAAGTTANDCLTCRTTDNRVTTPVLALPTDT